MSTREPRTMATTTNTTIDPIAQPTIEWPTLDLDHDPEPLATNDVDETDQQTLDAFGVSISDPVDPTPEFPIDDRDPTEQTTLFRSPDPWWNDADLLDRLYNDRDLSAHAIAADVFDGAVCYETVRTRLKDFGLMDRELTLAERLADPNVGPEDVGLSPSTGDDTHEKYTKRGRSA